MDPLFSKGPNHHSEPWQAYRKRRLEKLLHAKPSLGAHFDPIISLALCLYTWHDELCNSIIKLNKRVIKLTLLPLSRTTMAQLETSVVLNKFITPVTGNLIMKFRNAV